MILVQRFFLLWPPNSSSVVGNKSLLSHRFCGSGAQAWLRWVLRVKGGEIHEAHETGVKLSRSTSTFAFMAVGKPWCQHPFLMTGILLRPPENAHGLAANNPRHSPGARSQKPPSLDNLTSEKTLYHFYHLLLMRSELPGTIQTRGEGLHKG